MIRHLPTLLILFLPFALPGRASGHCDTTKGPVVTAARAALEAGDPNLVLHWVRAQDEAAVTAAFQQTLEVRALDPRAKALADRYFFETLVRIHRAGEGAPYAGLTDQEPEPIIAATDRALESGSAEDVEKQLVAAVRHGLAERFSAARAARDFRPGDVAAGRAFVGAYVRLTHWVEAVSTSAEGPGDHHGAAGAAALAAHPPHDSDPDTALSAGIHSSPRAWPWPWIFTAVLAIAALIEGAFLIRRRRRAPA